MSYMKAYGELVTGLRHLADCLERLDEPREVNPLPDTPTVTLEQVRAAMAAKSRAGHTERMHALLEKYGASKLSLIDPANYPALLADVEAVE